MSVWVCALLKSTCLDQCGLDSPAVRDRVKLRDDEQV